MTEGGNEKLSPSIKEVERDSAPLETVTFLPPTSGDYLPWQVPEFQKMIGREITKDDFTLALEDEAVKVSDEQYSVALGCSECSCDLVKNEETGQVTMLHVRPPFEDLHKNSITNIGGTKRVLTIGAEMSDSDSFSGKFYRRLNNVLPNGEKIRLVERQPVPTGSAIDVIYAAAKDTVYVIDREEYKILRYIGFGRV